VGNANFTSANGVVSGNGTETDPYIIKDYDINAATADGIEIRDTDAYFVIRNVNIHTGKATGNDGIALYDVSNGTVRDSTLSNNYDAIEIGGGTNLRIFNNTVSNNERGVSLSSSSEYNYIYKNEISSNTRQGIALFSSDHNEIYDNNVTTHQDGIYLSASNYNNVTDNRASNTQSAPIYLTVSMNNYIARNTVWSSPLYLIYIGSSSQNNVSSNNAYTCNYYGIYLIGAVNNEVYGNTVRFTDYAIYVWASSNNNRIEANNLTQNFAGINLRVSSSCTVIHNNVYNNDNYGIYTVGASNGNNISYNYVEDNGWGIQFEMPSSNNIIRHNLCLNNYAGIHFQASPSANNDVRFNRVVGNDLGIRLGNADFNDVYYNNISDSDTGIQIDSASNNNIGNNFLDTIANASVLIRDSDDITLTDNVMHGSGMIIEGITQSNWNSHTIDTTNTIDGKPVVYIKDQTGGTVAAGAGQVIIANSDFVELDNLDLSGGTCSVQLGFSSGTKISNSTLSSNSFYGISLYFSWSTTIKWNTIESNRLRGIILQDSSSNLIHDNIIGKTIGGSGIMLSSPAGNTIVNNTITANNDGIRLSSSNSNIINENLIGSNGNGTLIYDSSANELHHNSFISNNNQADDDKTSNSWNADYPACGNYWSDYGGVDKYAGEGQDHAGSDGVGDTPYSINIQNKDHFPLMKPPGRIQPSAPQEPEAAAGDSFVLLKWSPPAVPGSYPVVNYTIYRGTETNTQTKLKQLSNTTSFNDTGVVNGQEYYYRLTASNLAGESVFSKEVSAQPVEIIPEATIPQVPLNLTGFAGSDHILLSWEPPFYDGGATVTNYKLYKNTVSGSESDFIDVGNKLVYNDTDISIGITYYYKVGAVNAMGDGPLTAEVEVVITAKPGAPRNLTAIPGDLYVYLSWQAPVSDGGSPLQKYNIYRREASGGLFELLKSRVVNYFNDTDVSSGFMYYYVVTAVNALGESPDSEQISAKPQKVLKPPSAEISVDKFEGKAPLTVKFST
jgi:parallel beta-helix repeat protein